MRVINKCLSMLFLADILLLASVSIPMAAAITDVQVGSYQTYPLSHGDTWDPAWADDDSLYSANNDGRGWYLSSENPGYWNIRFNKLYGATPGIISGRTFASLYDYENGHGDGRNWKSSGLICLNGILYMAISRCKYQDPSYGGRQTHIIASIIKSTDHGANWTRTESDNFASPMWAGMRFSTPYFIHYGKDGAATVDSADTYVYATANNGFGTMAIIISLPA